jgi:nucleotide-binding universal stress UspA family protein
MTMRVLLATDGSDNANAAAACLAGFPLPEDAAVQVVTVAAFAPSSLDLPTVRDFKTVLRQEAHAVANAACAVLAKHVRTVEAVVLQGDPREELVRLAEEWPADLVVVGARGLSGMSEWLLGSVSLALARHAPCPVLVVKRNGRGRRRMLVAIDGSEAALAAAAFVARLPLEPGVGVQLVGVVERPRYPAAAPAVVAPALRAAIQEIVSERTSALGNALGRAAELFGERAARVERRLAVGNAPDEIVRMAHAFDADVVVLGARGLGAVKRLLLGSVSEAVLHNSERCVLIVRGTSGD